MLDAWAASPARFREDANAEEALAVGGYAGRVLVELASNAVDAARAALDLYEVDELGLDRLDRSVLSALCERFNGGPVGLSTLAMAVGEERETVEEVAEPFLVRLGFLARTPRGRIATPAAWRHLGLTPPAGVDAGQLPFDSAD